MRSRHRFILLVLLCTSLIVTRQIRMMRERQIIPENVRQLVVGTTDSWSSTRIELRRFERTNAREDWRQVGGVIHANAGKNGLAVGLGLASARKLRVAKDVPRKLEGDGKSPAGIFLIGRAYGYEDDAQPMPEGLNYRPLTESWKCVDDAKSAHYNRVIDASTVTPDWTSAEDMRRQDWLYKRVIEIAHNDGTGPEAENGRPTPGAGSCIFFHVQRGPEQPTSGCTSMPLEDIEEMIRWFDSSANPAYILLPADDYNRLSSRRGSDLPNF